MDEDRVTVAEAAERLGVKEQTVRKRISRGTLRSDKDEDGRVHVYIQHTSEDIDEDETSSDALVDSLQDQIGYLRDQLDAERRANEQNRRLLAAALERIPAIESSAPQNEPESAAPRSDRGTAAPGQATGPESRPWWRRVFGG